MADGPLPYLAFEKTAPEHQTMLDLMPHFLRKMAQAPVGARFWHPNGRLGWGDQATRMDGVDQVTAAGDPAKSGSGMVLLSYGGENPSQTRRKPSKT